MQYAQIGYLISLLCGVCVGTIGAMQPQLQHAIEQGDTAKVQQLVERQGANIHMCNDEGEYPVHIATKEGRYEILRYLCQKGASVEVGDMHHRTPLHTAALLGRKDIVRYLIEERNMPVDIDSNGNGTPLRFAIIHGDVDLVQYFIKQGASHYLCGPLSTSLHVATAHGQLAVVCYLINEQRMSVNQSSFYGTPLHMAAANGHGFLVTYFIEQCKASLHLRDAYQRTPLHAAARCGYESIVSYLIEQQKMSPYVEDKDLVTPLHVAASQGQKDVVRYLIDKQRVPVDFPSGLGTPLSAAAEYGDVEFLRYLIEQKNASPDVRGLLQTTPLHNAARSGRYDAVKYLIEQCGLSPDVVGCQGKTPLHEAAMGGYKNVIQYFIYEHGMSVNVNSKVGTPLHIAVQQGHTNLARYLVENNADICFSDGNGKTPLYLAIGKHYWDLAYYFVEQYNLGVQLRNNTWHLPLAYAIREGAPYHIVLCFLQYGSTTFPVGYDISYIYDKLMWCATEHTIRDYIKVALGQGDIDRAMQQAENPARKGIVLLYAYKLSQQWDRTDMNKIVDRYWQDESIRTAALLQALIDQAEGYNSPATEKLITCSEITTKRMLEALRQEIQIDSISSQAFLHIINRYADEIANWCKQQNRDGHLLYDIAQSPRAARCLPTFIHRCMPHYVNQMHVWQAQAKRARQWRDNAIVRHLPQSIRSWATKNINMPLSVAIHRNNTPFLAYHTLACALVDRNRDPQSPALLQHITEFAAPKDSAISDSGEKEYNTMSPSMNWC